MAAEAGGIGERLRAGREKAGFTVLQVAERIHTDPKMVEAVEADDYQALGAPVYARGHLRHYAELVGESGEDLVGMYNARSQVAQPDLTRIVKPTSTDHSNKLVAPAVVVLAVFAVAGAIWWISSLSHKQPQLSDTHVVSDEPPPPIATAPAQGVAGTAPEVVPKSSPVNPAAATDGHAADTSTAAQNPPTSGEAPLPPAHTQAPVLPAPSRSQPHPTPPPPAKPASKPAGTPKTTNTAPSTSASRAVAATSKAGSNSAFRTTSAPKAPAVAATHTPPPAVVSAAPVVASQSTVTLRFSADSWAEVYDASGSRLFYDVGAANSVRTVSGKAPLRVVLGNASGVSVESNGHSQSLSRVSRPDGSAQFSIDRQGQLARAKPAPDRG